MAVLVLAAGTFYRHDGAGFSDVHDPERTIGFELVARRFDRIQSS
jgi:hypothetical protein